MNVNIPFMREMHFSLSGFGLKCPISPLPQVFGILCALLHCSLYIELLWWNAFEFNLMDSNSWAQCRCIIHFALQRISFTFTVSMDLGRIYHRFTNIQELIAPYNGLCWNAKLLGMLMKRMIDKVNLCHTNERVETNEITEKSCHASYMAFFYCMPIEDEW